MARTSGRARRDGAWGTVPGSPASSVVTRASGVGVISAGRTVSLGSFRSIGQGLPAALGLWLLAQLLARFWLPDRHRGFLLFSFAVCPQVSALGSSSSQPMRTETGRRLLNQGKFSYVKCSFLASKINNIPTYMLYVRKTISHSLELVFSKTAL